MLMGCRPRWPESRAAAMRQRRRRRHARPAAAAAAAAASTTARPGWCRADGNALRRRRGPRSAYWVIGVLWVAGGKRGGRRGGRKRGCGSRARVKTTRDAMAESWAIEWSRASTWFSEAGWTGCGACDCGGPVLKQLDGGALMDGDARRRRKTRFFSPPAVSPSQLAFSPRTRTRCLDRRYAAPQPAKEREKTRRAKPQGGRPLR